MNPKALLLCALVALPSPCAAAVFKVLHNFGAAGDGGEPIGSLVLDENGNIYGATISDSSAGFGTVFVVHRNGTEAVLHTFQNARDGSSPDSGLVAGPTGVFYGSTISGGKHKAGTVFAITAKGRLTTVYPFVGGRHDGGGPQGSLIVGAIGTIFGTAATGGSAKNDGTVFGLTPDGTETTLHTFTGNDGADPELGVISDSNFNLYGATRFGGSSSAGTVFSIAPDGTHKVLHTFTGVPDNDGADPLGGLVFGPDGKLYGTTSFGGVNKGGILYRLSPNGSNYEIVHAFQGSGGGNPNDGKTPEGNLSIDSAGNIFGTTAEGGAGTTAGTVFEYSAAGTYRVVHSFTAATDGAEPVSGVTPGPNNTLYGTAEFGGPSNRGTVFSIRLTN
jgi:uncharacterized repeat protein (TIGR03803 family)